MPLWLATFHDGVELLVGELATVAGLVRAVEATGEHDLDPLGTALQLTAHRPGHVVGTVAGQLQAHAGVVPRETGAVAGGCAERATRAGDPRAERRPGRIGPAPCQVQLVALGQAAHSGDTRRHGTGEVLPGADGAVRQSLEEPHPGVVVHQAAGMGVAVPQAEHGREAPGVDGDRLAAVVVLKRPVVDQQVARGGVTCGDVQPGGAPNPQRTGGAHEPFPAAPLPAPFPTSMSIPGGTTVV